MKANEAPEKIYIQPSTIEELPHQNIVYTKPLADNSIEYTRADAFIEKAADWLKENLLNHTYVYEGEVGIGMAVFLEEFKQAMKRD